MSMLQIGGSSQKIYETMEWAGLGKKWTQEDWVTIFGALLSKGYAWDPETQTLKTMGFKSIHTNTPWVHVKPCPQKNCNMDHQIIFNTWGIVPPKCQECWKVVVNPKTFKQLMELEALEIELDRPSKCGIELRDYTPKHYGGYFYNNSLDEGRECYGVVRSAVDEALTDGKDVQVILKRACTEFEVVKGPSPFWCLSPEEEAKLELIHAFVQNNRSNLAQPDFTKTNVRLGWMLWAHSNGDMSYKEYNGGKALFSSPVTYHEGDIDGIKQDIACARAYSKTRMSQEDSVEFQTIAQEFADSKGFKNSGALIHSLGGDSTNPLKIVNFKKDYAEDDIGEHDELT